MNINEFMGKIKYKFKDEKLLIQALTHSSYANEKNVRGLEHNERLEFLGDAVLELVTSEFLYTKYPYMPEGKMTRTRARIVCEPTLAMCADGIALGKYLFLGNGEIMSGGRRRPSIVSDALEAVIGAIYIDGGIAEAEKFIKKFILNDFEHKALFIDSKSILQEIIQSSQEYTELTYVIITENGPAHDKMYTMAAIINGVEFGMGRGRTKKAAEQAAAYKAILKIQEKEREKEWEKR